MLPFPICRLFIKVSALGVLLVAGAANALVLGPGDVTVSTCGSSACIDVNNGSDSSIALNPTDPTTADIEVAFDNRIVLGDPGFGPPPFPGFPPPANPWTVTLSFETTGDNPGITWPLEDDDLRFTGLDGGAPDVDVLASNIDVESVVLAGSDLTWMFNVSQAQAGIAPGVGFLDFHLFDIQFNLGDDATLALNQIRIDPASAVTLPTGVPEPSVMALLGLGLLGLSISRRREVGHQS